MKNRLYTIQEVANILGVSTKTLRRWDQRGRFVPTRTAGNQRRYTQEQIQEFKTSSSAKASGGQAKLKNVSSVSLKSTPEPASPKLRRGEPFFKPETEKEFKPVQGLPSVLSSLPSGSFLRNHFLLKHKDEAESKTDSRESVEPTSHAKSDLARLDAESPAKRPSSRFMFAILLLILSFAGSVVLTKYNIVNSVVQKKEQFAKFIANLPRLPSGWSRQATGGQAQISLSPQDNRAVLAAADGVSDLILNINVPSFFSQSVGIGTTSIDPSAILDLTSEDKGFLAPRMTEAQIKAIESPAGGLFVYNTDTNHYNMYDGTSWLGIFSSIGDSTTGEAFTEKGTSGTALWFYDADGRGKLTTANLSAARVYTLPDAEGEISLLGQSISNSELVNKKVTVTAGTNLDGGGAVELGSSVTLNLKDTVDLSGALTVGGTTTLTGAATVTGATLLNGNVGLGDAIGDAITFSGRVALNSSLIPIGVTGTNDLGALTLPWDNVYADNVFAALTGTSGYWQRASGALSPTNITDDILLGATSTSSAKFGILNMAGGNPTATMSSNLSLIVPTGNAPAATFNLLNNGSLNFQRSPGGDAGLATALFIQNNGSIGIGNTAPGAMLSVGSSTPSLISSAGVVTIANTTDSTSGSTGSIYTAGGLGVTKDLAVDGGDIVTAAVTFNLLNATATTVNFAGAATTLSIGAATGTVTLNNATTAITGALTANGDITLGNAITDNITFTGRVALDSDLIPIGTDGTNDLGSAALPWDNLYADNIYSPSSGTSGYWQRRSNALSPENITDDLLLGATSTSSAKFGILNMAGGNPTATMSSNLSLIVPTGNAPAATFNLLNNGSLNFQRSPGGDAGLATTLFIQNNGNIGIGTTSPSSLFNVNGTLTATTINAFTLGGTIAGGGNQLNNIIIGTTTPLAGTFTTIQANTGITPDADDGAYLGQSGTGFSDLFLASGAVINFAAGDVTLTHAANVLGIEGGSVGIGTTNPLAALDIRGQSGTTPAASVSAQSSFAAMLIDNTGIGDLFTASKSGAAKFVITNAGNVGIGTANPAYTLDVNGDINIASGKVYRINGTQIAASDLSNGTTGSGAVVLANTPTLITPALGAATYTTLVGGNITDSGLTEGRVTFAGTAGILSDDSDLTFATDTLTVTKLGATTLTGTIAGGGNQLNNIIIGTTTPLAGTFTDLTANGNVTLGDNIADNITFTGRVAQDSDLIPIGTDGTNDLGSSALPWDNLYVDNIYSSATGISGYFQRNSGALSPANITDDLLLGGTGTASAKFGILNIAGGNPTATMSSNLSLIVPTGNAPAATFNLLNNGSLNFQRSPGGDAGLATALFIQNNGNIGIGTTSPSSLFNVNGTLTATTINAFTLGGTIAGGGNQLNNIIIGASTPLAGTFTTIQANTGITPDADDGAYLGQSGTGFSDLFLASGAVINFAAGDVTLTHAANVLGIEGGSVGIGNTAPLTALDVTGSASLSANLSLRGAGTAHTFNILDNGTLNFQRSPGGDAGLATALFIQNNGNIGIGTTAPTSKLHLNATATSGTIFDLAYGAETTATGDLIGSKFNLDDGTLIATNQNITGLEVKLPTVTNTHTSGTKTLKGFFVSFGTGSGLNHTGAGGTTTYNALEVDLPSLTQTAGTLNINGLFVDTPSSITTGGTASGVKVNATGVAAGSLYGVNITEITGGGGIERALNIGSGWDSVLSVNNTSIINGSGVTQIAGGGTSFSTYATGDMLYASDTNVLSKLTIGATEGYVLKVQSGVPVWGTIGGGACTNCLISDPSSTQTIAPTGQTTTGLSVRQTSTADPSGDIFNVTNSAGSTKYFYIDSAGVVNIPDIGASSGDQLTVEPGTDKFALKLLGTNVSTQTLQIIDSFNASGTVSDLKYPNAVTLSGALTGANIDLSTNLTATNQNVTGQKITLPVVTNTNTSGTKSYLGLKIAPPDAGGVNQNGTGGTTEYVLADLTMPALTQTAGTLNSYGLRITTPSSITTGGTAYGINLSTAGVGAGSLYGVNIGNITGGVGSERAINIGTGWDYGIYSAATGDNYFAGNVGIGITSPLTALDIVGSASLSADLSLRGAGTNHLFNILQNGTLNIQRSPGGDAGLASVMFIQNNGNVGIGTTAPSAPLQLTADNHYPFLIKNAGDYASIIVGDSNRTTTGSTLTGLFGKWNGNTVGVIEVLAGTDTTGKDDGELRFTVYENAVGDSAMIIKQSGNVGIGNITPLTALDVTGSASLSANLSLRGAGTAHLFNILQNGTLNIQRSPGGDDGLATALFIQNNGNIGIGTTAPAGLLDVTKSGTYGEVYLNDFSNTDGDDIQLLFRKAAGTSGSPGDVVSGERLGSMSFRGYHTDGYGVATAIQSYVDGTPGNGDMPGRIEFQTSPDGSATLATRMTIKNDGNVGIGTTSPLAALDVRGNLGTVPAASVSAQSSFAALLVDNTGIGDLFTASKSGAAKFVISNSGNVGIGIAAPAYTLDVNGDINIASGKVYRINGTQIAASDLSNGTTGSGAVVLANTPTLITPALGAATYTTLVGGNITDSGLTEGRVTFAGTAGILSDDADLTFATDTLTVTKLGATTLTGTIAGGGNQLNNIIIGTTTPLAGTFTTIQANTGITPDADDGAYLGTSSLGFSDLFLASGAVINFANSDVTLTHASNVLGIEGGSVGIGTTSPLAALDIRGNLGTVPAASVSAQSSFAALLVDNTGIGDLFTASKSGAAKFVITNAGNVGIGTAAPTSTLSVGANLFQVAGATGHIGIGTAPIATAGLSYSDTQTNQSSVNVHGLDINQKVAYTNVDNSYYHKGANIWGILASTNTKNLTAADFPGLYGSQIGLQSDAGAAGIVTWGTDLFLRTIWNAGTLTTWDGAYIANPTGEGTITNAYGLYIEDITKGATTNYAIYSAGGKNYFAGNIGIGNTTPLTALDVTGSASLSANLSLRGAGTAHTFNILDNGTLNFQRYPAGDAANNSSVLFLGNNGNVGIGTTTPEAKLQIGSDRVIGFDADAHLKIANDGETGDYAGIMFSSRTVAGLPATGLGKSWFGIKRTGSYGRNDFVFLSENTVAETVVGTDNEVMRITSAGNVGIGTTAPLTALDVTGSASLSANLSLRGAGTAHTFNILDNGTLNFQRSPGGDAGLATALFIQNNGNVGIGTTSPLAALDIRGNLGTVPAASISAQSSFASLIVDNTGIGDLFTASKSGAPKFVISNSGNVGIGTTEPRDSNKLNVYNSGGTGSLWDVFVQNYGSGNVDDTAGIGFVSGAWSGGASAKAKSAIVHKRTGGYGSGDLMFLVDSNADDADVALGDAKMVILSTGNVGIGTTAPLTALDVTGSASLSADLSLRGAGTAHTFNILDNGTLNIQRSPGGDAGLTSALFIQNNGRVGIGTTAPSYPLHVYGTSTNIVKIQTTGANDAGLYIDGNTSASGIPGLVLLDGSTAKAYVLLERATGPRMTSASRNDLIIYTETTNNIVFGTNIAERMRIASDGKVGIGTVAPLLRLDVRDSQAATAAAQIYNTSTDANADGLILKLGNTSTTIAASTNHFLSFETAGIGIVGSVQGSGGAGVTYATSGIADFAEYFKKDQSQSVPFGSAVCLQDNGLAAPCDTNNSRIIGVASERPAFLGGENLGDRSVAVGLVGQVRTRVSAANGAIKIGDPLTTSGTAGVAVKATSTGQILGKAIEPFDGAQGQEGNILVSVNIGWYNPSIYVSYDGTLAGMAETVTSIGDQLALQGDALQAQLALQDQVLQAQIASVSARLTAKTDYILANDPLFDSLNSKATAAFDAVADLQAKVDLLSSQVEQQASISAFLTEIQNGQVLGASISAELIDTLGDIEIQSATITDDFMVLGRTTVTDLGVTGNINAGLLAINGLDGEINTLAGDLRLQSTGLGGVDILNGKVTIDTQGNMTVAGTITADEIEANNYTVLGDQSIGSGAIPAGTLSIEIFTSVASESSKIFLTTTSLTDKQITVVQKSNGKFKVAIPTYSTQPITFDWWIVGNK